MRLMGARSGRVLLVAVLVLLGAGYVRDAVGELREYGRGAAALAFMRCLLAVSFWALAVFLWRRTRPRPGPEYSADRPAPGPEPQAPPAADT